MAAAAAASAATAGQEAQESEDRPVPLDAEEGEAAQALGRLRLGDNMEQLLVNILAHVSLAHRDPYVVRSTCKWIRKVYDDVGSLDNPGEPGSGVLSLWRRLRPGASPDPGRQTAEELTREARRQCNMRLRDDALLSELRRKVGGDKVAQFERSGFKRLALQQCDSLRSLPEGE